MKFTAVRSQIDNRIMSYTTDVVIDNKRITISKTYTPILGFTWMVNHHLAGGHRFDGGRSRHDTLAAAKLHAIQMAESLVNA